MRCTTMIHHSCGPRTQVDHNIYLGGFFKYEELGDLGDRKITIVTCLGNKGERTLGFDYSHKRTLNKDVDGARTTTTTTATATATDWCKFPNGHPKTLLPT